MTSEPLPRLKVFPLLVLHYEGFAHRPSALGDRLAVLEILSKRSGLMSVIDDMWLRGWLRA